jgi:tetratricopeptide (TPR) repeat protein
MDSLATCYSSIRVTGGARLHETSAAFMREYLLTPELRAGDEVKAIAVRASSAARQRQQKLEEELARLEDRCESDDWQEAVLDTVHWLLWHDEAATWRELMPRLIEGLGYRPRLAGSLLEVASALEIALSNDGRRRLKTLEQGMGDKATADDESTLLSELERWLKQHDAQDAYAAERRTVLDLLRGELFYRLEKYADALRQYKRVERGLPEDGEVLKKRLGAVFCDVGWELGWERGRALPSEEARLALACAVELVPDNSAYRVGLGVMLYGLKQQKKLLPR